MNQETIHWPCRFAATRYSLRNPRRSITENEQREAESLHENGFGQADNEPRLAIAICADNATATRRGARCGAGASVRLVAPMIALPCLASRRAPVALRRSARIVTHVLPLHDDPRQRPWRQSRESFGS